MRTAEENQNVKRSTGNTGTENLWIGDKETLIKTQGERKKNGDTEKAQERRVNTETQTGTETRISRGKTSGRIDIKRGESEIRH